MIFRISLARVAALALLAPAALHAQIFTAGDIVVTTYGNVGNAATNNTYTDGQPTPISLLEFSPTGGVNSAPVVTFTLPTTDSGSNLGVVGEYGSSSEGTIQLSGDGRYLAFAGYSATPSYAGNYSVGTTALAQSTDTAVPRVMVLVDAYGNVNSSTVLNDIYSTNNPRSVYTQNGSTLYLAGQGSSTADQGLFTVATGTNTTTGGAAPTGLYTTYDIRTAQIYNGNLYYSQDKKNKSTGIFAYNGVPTGSGASTTTIVPASNGLSGSAKVNYSPEGFYFANATTLYVADTGLPKSGGISGGGIQKWVYNGSAWILQYTLTDADFVASNLTASATSGETGFEAIAGALNGNTVTLYVVSYTAGDANPNGLYSITDILTATSSNQTFTKLQSSGADNVFKGVSLAPQAVPEPTSLALLAGGLLALGWFARRRLQA